MNTRKFGASVCLATLFTAPAAFADVTAQEVWDNWKSQMAMYGTDMITFGAETMSGNTLTIESTTYDADQDGITIKAEMGPISLTENGDGTVSVMIPEQYQMSMGNSENFAENHGTISITVANFDMVASGTADAINYDVSADSYLLELVEAFDGGKPVPVEASLKLNGLSGVYSVLTGDLQTVGYDLSASSMDVYFDLNEEFEKMNVSGRTTGMSLASSMIVPTDFDQKSPETMFIDGAEMSFDYTAGPSTYIISVTDGSGTLNMASATESGHLSFGLDKDAMSFAALSTGLNFQAMGGQVPLPLDITAEEYGVSFEMPLAKTEEPAPFAAGITLTDLGLNDMLWMMADPQGILPHDPITFQVAVTGAAKLFFDVMDPKQAAALEQTDVPGELHALTLQNLKLAIAGAEITGTGDFTFDNTDLQTYDGFPRPEGSLSLVGKGINGLLDKVEQMGLPVGDQIMTARMMLGMFTQSTGDDQIETTIDMNAQGNVMLNGQRIK